MLRSVLAIAEIVGAVVVIVTLITWGVSQVRDDRAPTETEKIERALGCSEKENSPMIEGSLGIGNVTAGDTQYAQSVRAEPDDVVKAQLVLMNRNVEGHAVNVRARLVVAGNPYDHRIEVQTCGSNARLLQDSVMVKTDVHAVVEFIPGSVVVRTALPDGVPVERVASDSLFADSRGESLGRLAATPAGNETGNAFTLTALARIRSIPQ